MSIMLKIQSRGTVTIPKKMREVLGVSYGDFLNVNLKNKSITLKPARMDTDLQQDILKSLRDIKKGDFISFSSAKEMRAKIK